MQLVRSSNSLALPDACMGMAMRCVAAIARFLAQQGLHREWRRYHYVLAALLRRSSCCCGPSWVAGCR